MIRIGAGGAGFDAPVEHLNACHRRIEERLDTLERVIPHFETDPAAALAAVDGAFRFLDTNGAAHTADEEESFFPRMAARWTEGEREFVGRLQEDHGRAEALYGELKAHVAAMGARPGAAERERYAGLVRGLCALYRRHIREEDERFPEMARRALSTEDLAAIGEEMRRRRGI